MSILFLSLVLGADIGSPLPAILEKRVSTLEAKVISLENDVEALKRDVNAKCDVASKSPEPKPASKCPDGTCADCKCTVGSECGCLKLAGQSLVAAAQLPELTPATTASTPVTAYREVRTCNGGSCTVQLVPVDATDETPQVVMQQGRSTYGNGGCVNGQCGVGAAGRVVKGFRLFRRRK